MSDGSTGAEALDELVLVGSQDAARAMRVELARLASPLGLDARAWKSRGRNALALPFDPAWVEPVLRYARTPSRLLWRWASIPTTRLEPLAQGLTEVLDGRPELPRGLTASVRVLDAGPIEASPLQVRGAVMSALTHALGASLDPEHPELQVEVRGEGDRVLVAEDLGGSLTHRGYRRPRQDAPLREHLAAQMLALSRWHPQEEPLVDPMCGSGTILAEAAGWAASAPIRRSSRWLPAKKVLPLRPPPLRLVGAEPDGQRYAEAKATLRQLRVDAELVSGSARTLDDDFGPRGVVVTNPPYGFRLGDEAEARAALRELRAWFLTRPPQWRLIVLGPPVLVEEIFGKRPSLSKPMRNGPLETGLFAYERAHL